MTEYNQNAVLALANTYAGFFARDFAHDVMRHLTGSYPVDKEKLTSYIDSVLQNQSITVGSTDTIGRFLFECAEHALEQGMEDPSSQNTWKQVSGLPSLYHSEIQSIIFSSACMYRDTVDRTILGVIARDAHMAAQSIAQTVQTRTQDTDTTGSVDVFNWGVLGDGVWLNAALLTAFNKASIFRPGDMVAAHYAETAFSFARRDSYLPILSSEERTRMAGLIEAAVGEVEASPEMDDLFTQFSPREVLSTLIDSQHLTYQLDAWKVGLTNTKELVWAVGRLSALARILPVIKSSVRKVEDDVIFDALISRIDAVIDVVCLCLAGFEAVRETRYANTLIMSVSPCGDDPKVTITVNQDLLTQYSDAGGDVADLIYFGIHLDPRRGIPESSNGWSLEYVLARKADIVAKGMDEENSRLIRLRNNDAAVIQGETTKIVSSLVRSYLETRQITTIPSTIHQGIASLARDASIGTESFNLDASITKLLTDSLGDTFVSAVSDRFITHLSSDNAADAKAFTVAQTAIADVIDYITK